MNLPTLAALVASAALLPGLAAAQGLDKRLAGVWTMTTLEVAGADGAMRPVEYDGQISFTADGHVAVQTMNPDPEARDTAYTRLGYEAYYGRAEIDEAAGTFTMTIESALARDLIGEELVRRYEVADDRLVLTPADPAEGWRVTYEQR